MSLPKAIFLIGPTACGKTGLAIELSKRLPVELISVDSALIYRGMDIGTAKPTADELAEAPHHLIDIRSPLERYSAAEFVADARPLMDDIVTRGRIPLLVGGTMLYFKALAEGLSDLPPANPAIRAELDARAAMLGWPALHQELARIDPQTAARLAPHDSQRLQRALEVWQLTGQPLSSFHADEKTTALPFNVLRLALDTGERAWIHERIARRFRLMLDAGFVDEMRTLLHDYPELHPDLPSMRCVGYRQAWEWLRGECSEDEFIERGIAATRQLAKRQITWMRSMPDLVRLECRSADTLTPALAACSAFLD